MTSTTPVEEIVEALGINEVTHEAGKLPSSYNVAPTQEIFVATMRKSVRKLDTMRWGLVPYFAKDVKGNSLMINARAEGLASKPVYRRPLEKRRCLIPFDGFYEWQRLGPKDKQPWYFQPHDGGQLAFAGLWDLWHDPQLPQDAEPLLSCTIITTEANSEMRPVHDRIPVMLGPDSWESWLDVDGTDVHHAETMLKKPKDGLLKAYKVSTDVNNYRNDNDSLVVPLKA